MKQLSTLIGSYKVDIFKQLKHIFMHIPAYKWTFEDTVSDACIS